MRARGLPLQCALCYRCLMRKLLLLLVFCASWGVLQEAGAQFVQQRFLPAHGERGKVGPPVPFPGVQIDKKLLRLAAGARIYDRSNRTIVHSHIPAGAEVLYAREQSGQIARMYILTEQEIARLKQAKR